MKGENDEKIKQTVPLFPGLHISSDADRGGPRPPPRNKMALLEEYGLNSGPRPLLPLPPASGCSNAFSQSSSNNVGGVKRKSRPMNQYPTSSDWYYSPYSGGVSGQSNYPNPIKSKCISSAQPPCGFASYSDCCTDETDDFGVSSFLQSYGNLQLHVKKDKFDGARLLKESEDHAMRHGNGNVGEESTSRLFQGNGNRISDMPEPELCLELKSVGDGRRISCPLEDSACSSSRGGECEQWGLSSNENDSLSLEIGGETVKSEETLDSYPEIGGSISILGLDLSHDDEVARVIGPRLFFKARKTMVHQQKTFSLQMFELHRLITVQRHIARSPEILDENYDPNKPSIKFPPIGKLLYVSPLDPSPPVAKPKTDSNECGGEEDLRGLLPYPLTDFKKPHFSQPNLIPKSLPNPASIPIDPKLSPWCIPMPAGNQWLVPVRSPSEGLIYKPYPGPCYPPTGYMAPVYGSLGLGGGASYGIPPPNELGNGYLPPELKQEISTGELDKVSSLSENLHRSNGSEMQGSGETSPSERMEGDNALSLFPTTPCLPAKREEQRVQAIKVVPHNRMSASASAARIFQSIQEERRKNE